MFNKFLLLDSETYLQEYLVLINNEKTTLRLCTSSLYYDTDDAVVRIPLKSICDLNYSSNEISVTSTEHTVIKQRSPYVTKSGSTTFTFSLLLTTSNSLSQSIHKLLSLQNLTSLERQTSIKGIVKDLLLSKPFDMTFLRSISENVLLQTTAKSLSLVASNPGHLVLTNQYVYFSEVVDDFSAFPVRHFPYSIIKSISFRTYSVEFPGIELFFDHDDVGQIFGFDEYYRPKFALPSLYFVLESNQIRNQILTLISQNFKEHTGNSLTLNDHSRLLDIMSCWHSKKLSNFDYLLALNDAAGRSFRDLTQYPVFPWILKDYKAEQFDLNDPSIYRDLSKPIGAINQKRLESFQSRYAEMMSIFHSKYDFKPLPGQLLPEKVQNQCNLLEIPYMFGSFYSCPGFVLYYLVRVCPELVLRFQSGSFDSPDRSFFSIIESFDHVSQSKTDLKEAIPELYGDSSFLINNYDLDLGIRSDGRQIGDVHLPNWASDCDDFVTKNRMALESDNVSNQLQHWIDLIFGFKQRGIEALSSSNVYCHSTYPNAIDLSILSFNERISVIDQIKEFGSCCQQLFIKPHPKKGDVFDLEVFESLVDEGQKEVNKAADFDTPIMDVTEEVESLSVSECKKIQSFKTPITFASLINHQSDLIVAFCCNDGVLRLMNLTSSQVVSVPLSRLSLTSIKHLKTSNDVLLLIGCLDNSVYFYSINQSRVINVVNNLSDAVSCLSIIRRETDDVMIAIGLWSSCVETFVLSENFELLNDQVYSDHDSEVSCILLDYIDSKEVLVSGCTDGVIHLYQNLGQNFDLISSFDGLGSINGIFLTNDDTILVCTEDSLHGFLFQDDELETKFEINSSLGFTSSCYLCFGDLVVVGTSESSLLFFDSNGQSILSHTFELSTVKSVCCLGNKVSCGFEDGSICIVELC
ncbi:hypothetical protein P9112_009063 [Eukaryota sp. TZLM1-RC]